MKPRKGVLLAVVRIKGTVGVRPDVKRTLELLNLKRKYNATLLMNSGIVQGMLQKAKDYITFGEIDKDVLKKLLLKRGRTRDGKKLTPEVLKDRGIVSIDELVSKMMAGEIKLNRIKWLKPYFRLSPPSKGFKGSTLKSVREGGELGYRGEKINNLLVRMI